LLDTDTMAGMAKDGDDVSCIYMNGLSRKRGGYEYTTTNVPFLACQHAIKSTSPFRYHVAPA
jgi:hypothetical protein